MNELLKLFMPLIKESKELYEKDLNDLEKLSKQFSTLSNDISNSYNSVSDYLDMAKNHIGYIIDKVSEILDKSKSRKTLAWKKELDTPEKFKKIFLNFYIEKNIKTCPIRKMFARVILGLAVF